MSEEFNAFVKEFNLLDPNTFGPEASTPTDRKYSVKPVSTCILLGLTSLIYSASRNLISPFQYQHLVHRNATNTIATTQ